MKKRLLFSLLLCTGSGAAMAQAFQGFDGSAANTWPFTPTPAAYLFGPSLNDMWKDTTYVGNTGSGNTPITAAAQGTRFWAMWDLENPWSNTQVPAPYYHTLDFAPVALNPLTAYTFRFKYFTHHYNGSNPPDSLGYILEYNNGTAWNMANYVNLPNNSQHWDSVAVNVPAGSTFVRVRFRARMNGGDDWDGLDAVEVAAGTTASPASISLGAPRYIIDEAADTLKVPVIISNRNGQPSSVTVNALSAFGSATAGSDFQALDTVLTWTSASPDTQYATFRIINDAAAEATETFGIGLSNSSNAAAGANRKATIYIRDNDYAAPVARKNIELQFRGRYTVPGTGGSAEIVVHDSASNRLFVVNSLQNILHIVSFANPAAPALIDTVQMSQFGGGINSVAVHKGIVAVAVEAGVKTDPGKIVFLDTAGNFLREVAAGPIPDMITFSPDGRWVMTANEGEPTSDYSIDPEGSVTIVDLQNGVAAATAVNAGFSAFNGQEAQLRSSGVRIYGPGATAAKDFEPEYITINSTSDTAYVSLQENNAIAVVHIPSKTVTRIMPLGYVDHSLPGNGLDASDQGGEVLIASWPVRGLYLPDAISSVQIGGQTYLLTANEGDARDYNAYSEEVRIGSNAFRLDSLAFPHADLLKANTNLGRLNAVNNMGDSNGDGYFEAIYVLGGRSFTLRNAASGAVSWNSGDQFEQITAADPKVGKLFNAGNASGDNTRKNRSDNKGPEPEGIVTGVINDTTYAFIALERIGGVMAYDVSNPQAPVFVQYINTRDTAAFGGDQGAEGIVFIPAKNTPTRKNYVLTANEVSGTVAVFEISAAVLPNGIADAPQRQAWNVYPNPVQQGHLFFSRSASGSLLDMSGRPVRAFREANGLSTEGLAAGNYLLQADGLEVKKVVVE